MDYVVGVIVTFDANLMQDMLAIRSRKYHLGLLVGLQRSEKNIGVQDHRRILGLPLVLD